MTLKDTIIRAMTDGEYKLATQIEHASLVLAQKALEITTRRLDERVEDGSRPSRAFTDLIGYEMPRFEGNHG